MKSSRKKKTLIEEECLTNFAKKIQESLIVNFKRNSSLKVTLQKKRKLQLDITYEQIFYLVKKLEEKMNKKIKKLL